MSIVLLKPPAKLPLDDAPDAMIELPLPIAVECFDLTTLQFSPIALECSPLEDEFLPNA